MSWWGQVDAGQPGSKKPVDCKPMGEGGQRWHPVSYPLCRGHHSLLQRAAKLGMMKALFAPEFA